ncbi:MAG: hypothetical protein R6W71_04920 [Bacteroidales bacterium]|jgi:uncharacterized phage protein (TIGR02220 family)
MNLPMHLFWDVDYGSIDWDKHRIFVITRVCSKGSLSDWKEIIDYYGAEEIRRALMQARYLDPRTLAFSSFYFNTPKEQFRCCNINL